MKKLILSVVFVVLGLTTGCRLCCAPYDCCGPVYSNPHNCDPHYRSGSAFNADCQCAGGVISATPVVPATQVPVEAVPTTSSTPAAVPVVPAENPAIPAATPTTLPAPVPTQVPATPVATPVAPAPTATPAPLPSAEVPANTQYVPQ